MHSGMARGTERDQVLLGAVTGVAPKPLVVYFQVRHPAAGLAPPIIAPQNLLP
jgi:hypothetical protein